MTSGSDGAGGGVGALGRPPTGDVSDRIDAHVEVGGCHPFEEVLTRRSVRIGTAADGATPPLWRVLDDRTESAVGCEVVPEAVGIDRWAVGHVTHAT
jgi:hypothetical protein